MFVGAGTSGRIAAAEAAELPGTFGLDRAPGLAGGSPAGSDSTDDDEDDLAGPQPTIADLAFAAADVLVAVAASGSDAVHARAGRTAAAGQARP